MNTLEMIQDIVRRAKQAFNESAVLSAPKKNAILKRAAAKLESSVDRIREANEKDLAYAKDKGLNAAMVDRLTLDKKRILEMALGLKEIIALEDPVGKVVKGWTRPNGLHVEKVRIPLGVICIIYEARPNVTVDAASLCLKSGNVVVLRGGSEAIHSNKILGEILRESLKEEGVNPDLVQVVPVADREAIKILLE
jgi:glutamate-5-semialdehyde dehydrogenase